ncbi:PqqD family peptide modification chaperone [Microbacterium sp. 2MCAF23]|uniref:PqqD family protein n=1 Tax=Microbacterium sp. 2MCAF23 TaxID=3232985 RepID=UPI003F944901
MTPDDAASRHPGYEPLDVGAFGVRIRLTFDDDLPGDTVEGIRASWAGARLPYVDTIEPGAIVPVVAGPHPDVLAESLTVQVTLAALSCRSGELFLFHACGVADPAGRVAAFVGPSGRGKTTLSRALGAVHGYISDETIAVDLALSVLPYRKPLSVVRAGRPKEQISPDAAGLHPVPEAPLALTALVLITRDAEQPDPVIEQVPFPEAIAELAPQMSYLAELPTPLQTLAALCDRIGGVVRLTYPEATTVPPILPRLLDHAWVHEAWAPAPAGENREFDLSAVADAIRCGDRVVVLAQRWVHVLDGIAPVIWDSLRAGRTADEIVADVVAEFGAPAHGEPRELVQAALGKLVDAGVLRRR